MNHHVIGGSSGIGAAVAQVALARGAHVIVAGRRLAPGSDSGLRNEPVDVTDSASLKQLFETVGRFDHLVYTSGAFGAGQAFDRNRPG